jgi:8-oxo-dGTP pyrophosphatase MutT (NUDIX family)
VPISELLWTAEEGRRAAVALLFLPDERPSEEPWVVLLRRSIHVASHKGQICLPGGLAERGETPRETATREASEELGVEPSTVRLWGGLPPQRSLDGREVHVFLGALEGDASILRPSTNEAEAMYLVPWRALTRDRHERFEFTMFGQRRQSLLFHVAGQRVWGLTASIIESAQLVAR